MYYFYKKFDVMNKLFTVIGCGLLLGSISCNDQHEVVPPPVEVVELECSCEATIDGTNYSYLDTCSYDNIKNISTSSTSTAKYSAQVQNVTMNEGFEIEMRSLNWIDNGSNNPTTADWIEFFETNLDPNYYLNDDLGTNGVVIKWTDPNGAMWQSDTSNHCSTVDFLYTEMEHDSDQTGNYMKFKGIFNCPLIKSDGTDTVCVENGIIKTSFKRE